jgi:PAS domain S-box-containing protein
MPARGEFSFGSQATEILERISEGFYAIDSDWRLVYLNRAAEVFWGLKREAVLGKSMLSLFPRFEGSAPHAAHKQAIDSGTPVRIETISTANDRPVELSLFPAPGGLSVYFRDTSRVVQLEKRLRERDEMLTLAELHAGIGVWDVDLVAQTLVGTPQFFRLHGLGPTVEPVSFETTRSLRHPQDRDRVVQGFAAALESGAESFETEYRIVRPDGQLRWIFGRGRVVRDGSGAPVRYSGIDIDITERKRQEDRLRIVTHELRHRANNTLAVLQAMARQTLRASVDLDDFEVRFDGRIRALADANDLLVKGDWRGVEVSALVEAQLRPFVEGAEGRLALTGPPVELNPKAVQTIGLALHELATNASKYGALSTADGTINVDWLVHPGEQLEITWRESGGPPVMRPERSGFGHFVIETMVKSTLSAEVTVDFAPDGVCWKASFTLGEAPEGG